MSIVSKLVGAVVDGNPKLAREISNERFYTIDVNFKNIVIPVLLSEYNLAEQFTDVIEVTGCLVSFRNKGQFPSYYIYATEIHSVEMDTQLVNNLSFCSVVTKVCKLKTDAHGYAKLPLVVTDHSPLHTISVLYLCVKDNDARKLKNKEKGYIITCEGHLRKYREVYEVAVDKIISISEKE